MDSGSGRYHIRLLEMRIEFMTSDADESGDDTDTVSEMAPLLRQMPTIPMQPSARDEPTWGVHSAKGAQRSRDRAAMGGLFILSVTLLATIGMSSDAATPGHDADFGWSCVGSCSAPDVTTLRLDVRNLPSVTEIPSKDTTRKDYDGDTHGGT
jgi:hypothetical protein